MSDRNELEAFVACFEGADERRWDRFIEVFGERVRGGVARAMLRIDQRVRREEMDDLVQEVYCRLLERCRSRRGRFHGRTVGEAVRYLHRVCESVVVDCLRSRRAAKRGGRVRMVELDATPEGAAEILADPGPSPESEALARELRAAILGSCRSLFGTKHLQRDLAIFERAVLDGWTSREIAEGTDCGLKAGSIDSLVHRQRKRLRSSGLAIPHR